MQICNVVEQIAEIVPGDVFERGTGKEDQVFCRPGLKWCEAPVLFCPFDVYHAFDFVACPRLDSKRLRQKVSVEGAVKRDGQWLSRPGARRVGDPEA